jgi:hypothetical protein
LKDIGLLVFAGVLVYDVLTGRVFTGAMVYVRPGGQPVVFWIYAVLPFASLLYF